MEDFLSRVIFFAERGDPLPIAYKKAKESSKGKKAPYELTRQLLLSYYSLEGKSGRKKARQFLIQGVKVTLPNWFEEELRELYDVEKLKKSFTKRIIWIRVNTLKVDEDKTLKEMEEKGIVIERDRDIKYAYKVLEGDVTKSKAFKEFKVIIQDKASMAVVEALRPQRSELIYDMTSSPGVKASLIMALTENKGKLVVADIDPSRLIREREFLKRVGANLDRIDFILQDSTEKDIRYADKVLLDAPCSSTGMISNEPTVLLRLTKERIRHLSELQRRLLNTAVRISSHVIYATCSLLPDEGEYVVRDFSSKPALNFGENVTYGNRFIPYIHETEGFFLSKVTG